MKERILKGAEELFLQYGIKSITMDAIAKHLGISKKTIYQFFKDKNDIVYQVCQTHLDGVLNYLEEIIERSSDAIEEFMRTGDFLMKVASTTNPAVLYDLKKYHPKAWKYYQDYKEKMILQTVINNLQEGVTEGYFRPGIKVEILARLRIEEIQLAFDPFIFPKDQFGFAEIQQQFLEHFVRGILTEEGVALLEERRANLIDKNQQI